VYPQLLKLLAHDIRWHIIQMLLTGDYRVQEIQQELAQPTNLVSYHLRLLRTDGLIHDRRSDADGRDVYYHLDSGYLAALYQAVGDRLAILRENVSAEGMRVAFICTGNSARSQMAEALFRFYGGEATSAGTEPKPLHPLAVQAMAERGIDIQHQQSRHIDAIAGQSFDYVITVCDRAREACPPLPGQHIHWSISNPAGQDYPVFKATADDLDIRIRQLLRQQRNR
jgi:protein-tyrosine-phosphatase